ncbi:MAG TPA: response regulator [Dehalococcoidia bacterium]|nr:response regulator [Dehalococcoidia bacterium]
MLQALNPKDARVLLVEDGPNDQAIAVRALQSFGIRHWRAARTAEDALVEASRHKYDVALVDYRLPRMNGLEFMEKLQSISPDSRVIVVTGVRQESVAVAAMKLGASDYITKDEYHTSGIIRALQAALRERLATAETEQRTVLAGRTNDLNAARVEARWLLQAIDERHGYRLNLGSDDALSDAWLGVVQLFATYISESYDSFPDPATESEDALLRVLLERESSPRDVICFYIAALQELERRWNPEQASVSFRPVLFLCHVLACIAEECQVLVSLQGLDTLRQHSA